MDDVGKWEIRVDSGEARFIVIVGDDAMMIGDGRKTMDGSEACA